MQRTENYSLNIRMNKFKKSQTARWPSILLRLLGKYLGYFSHNYSIVPTETSKPNDICRNNHRVTQISILLK